MFNCKNGLIPKKLHLDIPFGNVIPKYGKNSWLKIIMGGSNESYLFIQVYGWYWLIKFCEAW
jgi:hypothetical protein